MTASTDAQTSVQNEKKTDSQSNLNGSDDTPVLTTVNGGYSHTTASKAKISAANKGKVPWNKGKHRSEEVKARIAEGVRRKNRERFLAKLVDLGLTEEEFEAQKKEERRKKDAERLARKTAKGGYTPTAETKAKISSILKEKWANGEIKKREYNGPYRKGFKHSEETKVKISQALKKKWAEDEDYKEKMKNCASQNGMADMRQKISSSLKEKWQDPEFRSYMMEKFKKRRKPSGSLAASQRKKISETMKLKWQDDKYRTKALKGMEKHRKTAPLRLVAPRKKATITSIKTVSGGSVKSLAAVKPKKKKTIKKKKKPLLKDSASTVTVKASRKVKRPTIATSTRTSVNAVKPIKQSAPVKKKKKKKAAKKLKDDGNIERLREERRDLFDLLYGDDPGFLNDDDEEEDDEDDILMSTTATTAAVSSRNNLDPSKVKGVNGVMERMKSPSGYQALLGDRADLDDDNLDDFDPYGLEDF